MLAQAGLGLVAEKKRYSPSWYYTNISHRQIFRISSDKAKNTIYPKLPSLLPNQAHQGETERTPPDFIELFTR